MRRVLVILSVVVLGSLWGCNFEAGLEQSNQYSSSICPKEIRVDVPGIAGVRQVVIQNSNEFDLIKVSGSKIERLGAGHYMYKEGVAFHTCKLKDETILEFERDQATAYVAYNLVAMNKDFIVSPLNFDRQELDKAGLSYQIKEADSKGGLQRLLPESLQSKHSSVHRIILVNNSDFSDPTMLGYYLHKTSQSFRWFK